MNRAIIAIMVLLLGGISSAWAYRVIEQTEDAYELGLNEVLLPLAVTGSVTFNPCPTCPTDSFHVPPATTYSVNGTPLEFKDFLEAVQAIRKMDGGNQNTAVYLFFDIESRRVNRLHVDHFNR